MTRKVSRYQALFRYFPDRPWNSEYGVARTAQLIGRQLGPEYDDIRQGIATLIEHDFRRKVERETKARVSRAQAREAWDQAAGRAPTGVSSLPSADSDAAATAFLERIASPLVVPTVQDEGQPRRGGLNAECIELRVIDGDAEIRSETYPPLFLCEECHGYYFLDPNGAQSLKCPDHGGTTFLRQVPIVFSCARCANIEPLLPFNVQTRNLVPGRISCRSGHPLTLTLSSNLANATWGCTGGSDCPAWEAGNRVSRKCAICDVDEPSSRSIMAPRSATASEIASPLTISYVRDRTGLNIRLASLRAQYRRVAGSFNLGTVEPGARARLAQFGIHEIFDVNQIQSILVCYGYRSLIHSQPNVDIAQRYPRFFQPQPRTERFRAFATIVEGKGLILALDPSRLSLIRQKQGHKLTYSQRITTEIAELNNFGVQALLAVTIEPDSYCMTKLLHTMEHALRAALIAEIGLDSFDSRILVEDAAILFFETRDLGDGGITQLAYQRGAMASWLDRARRKLEDCPQLCERGCIACVKVDNTTCHGFLAHEFTRWMPPNVLLDRKLVTDWIELNADT